MRFTEPMSHYKRLRVAGATYFFTVNLADRGQSLLVDRINTLRWAYAKTHAEHPIHCDAMVILPDHLHAIWTMPQGDSDFSVRWRKIKARFSAAIAEDFPRSDSKVIKRERGIWQRRFWEHMVRNADEYSTLMRHCRENPVKHGLVARAEDWAFSSFNRMAA